MSDEQKDDYTLKFKVEQLPFAYMKLMSQNNAMLRLILHNQGRIMKKLKLKPEFPMEPYQDLDPFKIPGKEPMRSEDHIDRLEYLVAERMWEFVNLHVVFEKSKGTDIDNIE
jgi:hypothetical protein